MGGPFSPPAPGVRRGPSRPMDPSIPEGGWDSCCRSGSHRRFRAEPQGENRSSHLFQKTTSRKSQPSLGEYRRQYLEKPPEPAVARPNGGWRQSPSIAGHTSNSVGQPQDINLRAQGIPPEPVFSEPKGQTTFGPVPGKAAPRWNASRFEPRDMSPRGASPIFNRIAPDQGARPIPLSTASGESGHRPKP